MQLYFIHIFALCIIYTNNVVLLSDFVSNGVSYRGHYWWKNIRERKAVAWLMLVGCMTTLSKRPIISPVRVHPHQGFHFRGRHAYSDGVKGEEVDIWRNKWIERERERDRRGAGEMWLEWWALWPRSRALHKHLPSDADEQILPSWRDSHVGGLSSSRPVHGLSAPYRDPIINRVIQVLSVDLTGTRTS